MKRKCFYLSALIISVTLVFIQICTLQFLFRWVENQKDGDSELLLKLVKHVTDAASTNEVPLFLIDPTVLGYIEEQHPEIHQINCQILCQKKKVLQLATISDLSNKSQRDLFIKTLSKNSQNVVQSKGYDPNLLRHGLEVTIPFHYFIHGDKHIIHIVIFTERAGKAWWNGPINRKTLSLINLEDNIPFRHEGLYQKVEIHLAVIDGIKLFLPYPISVFTKQLNTEKTLFKECNYTRASHFFKIHGKESSKESAEFQTKAWKLLAKATRLLDKLGIPFWLSSGTCLGYYRQCSIIPYSQDVDIGIFIKDFHPDIATTFSTHNLPLTHSFGYVADSLELSFRDGDVKLDVFFFYEGDHHVWNGGTQARTGKKYKYMFPKFHLCWTEFLELLVRIPCETESYIRANYGPNWFEPVKVWDWKKSPPNVVENGAWPVDQWPEVIQLIPLPEQK